MSNKYNVNIAGHSLVIMTERSEIHMKLLAETLCERVREIQKTGGTTNYLNVIMLAAIELADDVLAAEDLVLQTRKKNRELEEKALQFEEETNGLKKRLEKIDEEIFALQTEVEMLRQEREGLQRKYDRRSRDILEALDNALK